MRYQRNRSKIKNKIYLGNPKPNVGSEARTEEGEIKAHIFTRKAESVREYKLISGFRKNKIFDNKRYSLNEPVISAEIESISAYIFLN